MGLLTVSPAGVLFALKSDLCALCEDKVGSRNEQLRVRSRRYRDSGHTTSVGSDGDLA